MSFLHLLCLGTARQLCSLALYLVSLVPLILIHFPSSVSAAARIVEVSLWQQVEGTCDKTAESLAERFAEITGYSSFVQRVRAENKSTCRVRLQYNKTTDEQDNFIMNHNDFGMPYVDSELFRFYNLPACLAKKSELTSFFEAALDVSHISSGCYSHDNAYFALFLSGGKAVGKELRYRNFENIYDESFKLEYRSAFAAELSTRNIVYLRNEDQVAYGVTADVEVYLSQNFPNLKTENDFIMNLTSKGQLVFETFADCEEHGRDYVVPAFKSKVVGQLYDGHCQPKGDDLFEFRLLFASRKRPRFALQWLWQEISQQSFVSLNQCIQYLSFAGIDSGMCSYGEPLNRYRIYEWEP